MFATAHNLSAWISFFYSTGIKINQYLRGESFWQFFYANPRIHSTLWMNHQAIFAPCLSYEFLLSFLQTNQYCTTLTVSTARGYLMGISCLCSFVERITALTSFKVSREAKYFDHQSSMVSSTSSSSSSISSPFFFFFFFPSSFWGYNHMSDWVWHTCCLPRFNLYVGRIQRKCRK